MGSFLFVLSLIFVTACSSVNLGNDITEKDLENLKDVLEKEQPEYVAAVQPDYTIEIGVQNGKYIRGHLLTSDGEYIPSYPAFYAFKSDNGWKIIFSGQETPPCDKVNELNFPNDIIPECVQDNSVLIQR